MERNIEIYKNYKPVDCTYYYSLVEIDYNRNSIFCSWFSKSNARAYIGSYKNGLKEWG